MSELRLRVPTYYHGEFAPKSVRYESLEFGKPYVPVLIRRSQGVRIVLGSYDYSKTDFPDVQIERRPGGWAIFLHPVGGSDPSGYVYFLDDGHSFLLPESGHGPTPVIELLDSDSQVLELDQRKYTVKRTVRNRNPL